MKIFSRFRKAATALALVGLVLTPSITMSLANALSEWGPEGRQTFTWTNPASFITFNSITDNPDFSGDPAFGHDERHFFTANNSGVTNYNHNLPVKDGDVIALRTYFHNNASADLNLVAINTRVNMLVPGADVATNNHAIVSHIKADNANPGDVWDTVHLTGTQPFTLEYQNDAKLYTNALNGVAIDSAALRTDTGAQVGYDAVNGRVPGCNQFSGYVTVHVKVLAQQTPPPVYSCEAFNIVADVNRSVKVSTFNTTAQNGAVFKNAVVDWGDGSTPLTDANIVGKTHQYAKDGTYTITAVAHFDVDGQDKTAGGPACQKQVTFTSDKPPVVTPPTTTPAAPGAPTKLVNTGVGSTLGLFALVTAAAAYAHRRLLTRRLGNQ